MRISVEQHVRAPRATVWDVLTTWERQPEWMVDAKSVEVITPHRVGEGVTIECPTNLLGLTVKDIMRVTRWVEGRELEVVHLGKVIKGTGAFELRDEGKGTLVTWWEQIDPPLGKVGALGARLVVAPFTTALFRRSLRGLADVCEAEARAA